MLEPSEKKLKTSYSAIFNLSLHTDIFVNFKYTVDIIDNGTSETRNLGATLQAGRAVA